MRLPRPCLVVLVGPSGAGKSRWAASHFRANEIVSSDALRAVVGEGEHDLDATSAAFGLLDRIVDERLRRKLTTVIDTLGMHTESRRSYLAKAREAGIPAIVVGFDTPPALCRQRNRRRRDPVPARVLDSQLKSWREAKTLLAEEPWDDFLVESAADEVEAPEPQVEAAERPPQTERPRVAFALHISDFSAWDPVETGEQLGAIARRAEEVGFTTISVMDHMIQIPQVGRAWDPILESYTTAAYLAGVTEHARLGVLVTAPTFRNPAHLAKIVAGLDVLSGGRAFCGLGAGWYKKEHDAYGWGLPPLRQRFELLEDTLQLLPMMWGPGSKRFEGKTITVEEAVCYPRPVQERIPILVGGMGEKRTLRLAARYADACNLFGDAVTVAGKVAVLGAHCREFGRDPAEVEVTHLAPCLVGEDQRDVDRLVDERRPPRSSPSKYARATNAGTLADQLERFEGLAGAGVQRAFVSIPGLSAPHDLDAYAELIEAFR